MLLSIDLSAFGKFLALGVRIAYTVTALASCRAGFRFCRVVLISTLRS